jgi:hypothetical protein
MIRTVLAALLAGALLPAAWSQEAGVTRRAVDLRESPADAGRSIASLPAQAPVTRLPERKGPWVQVRTAAGATGWLHLFDVAPASAPAADGASSNPLRGVANLFGGSRATTAPTNAAGIRGLDREDLARAEPDAAAVSRMEAARQGEADVRSFARRAGWQPTAVEPLPEPAAIPFQPAGNPGQQVSQ